MEGGNICVELERLCMWGRPARLLFHLILPLVVEHILRGMSKSFSLLLVLLLFPLILTGHQRNGRLRLYVYHLWRTRRRVTEWIARGSRNWCSSRLYLSLSPYGTRALIGKALL